MPRAVIVLYIVSVVNSLAVRNSSATTSEEDLAKLRWLDHADPAADFQRHVVREHDTRFISIYGFSFSTEFPGLPDTPDAQRLAREHGKRRIEGTTDIISSAKHHRLLDKAFDYAKRYNTMLLNYLHRNS